MVGLEKGGGLGVMRKIDQGGQEERAVTSLVLDHIFMMKPITNVPILSFC